MEIISSKLLRILRWHFIPCSHTQVNLKKIGLQTIEKSEAGSTCSLLTLLLTLTQSCWSYYRQS